MPNQPNILFIMSDQQSIRGVGAYGNAEVKTPHIDALARAGVLFRRAVCPSPICVASRAAFVTGKHIHRIEAWDNGAPFGCDEPTFLHHLAAAGYRTAAAGKLHFIGPDQTHGFHERLTPDVYPADMVWIDDWDQPVTRDGGNNRDRVAEGGIIRWSHSRDYDENVQFRSLEYLRSASMGRKAQPFFLFVSFTHPHDPYQTTREYWNRYEGVDIRLPSHWDQDVRTLSPMNQWVQRHHDLEEPVRREDALRSRRAYYGNCSYVDDKVGELLRELARQGLADNTVVFFASDHGEMLGEHGMWSKRTFYEASAAVPLMMRWPDGRFAGRQVDSVVSLLDVYPTLLDLAGARVPGDLDAQDLIPLAAGETPGRDEAFCEYDSDGVLAPCRMIRRGRYKLCYAYGQTNELFDLDADPEELNNLIDSPPHAAIAQDLLARLTATWDPSDIDRRVRASQKRRRFIARVRLDGGYPWQFICDPARPDELRKGAGIGCGAVIPKEKKG